MNRFKKVLIVILVCLLVFFHVDFVYAASDDYGDIL